MTPTFAAILVWLAVQLAVGVWVSRRIRNESDYLVAGRSLGYTLATFSLFATWFGAETVVGSAGAAYRDGVSLASAEPFGYGLCLVAMGAIFAVPLWRRRLTTLADLFRQRFSGRVERVAAIVMIPGSLFWAAAQIRAFGHVLATVTDGIPVNVAIAAAAGFAMLYTVFGGLLADAITDVLQGSLLVVGLAVVLAGVLLRLPESSGASSAFAGLGPVSILPAADVSPWAMAEEWAIPVFGSVIAAELVGRIIATRSPTVARRSSLGAGLLYIAAGLIPLALGLLGQRIVPALADPEQVIPAVAQAILPGFFFVIFAGALISAILSTVDSTLLMSSGLLSHNLIVPAFRIQSERVKITVARVGVLVFAVVAYVQAVRAEGVFELIEESSAFGGSGVLVTTCFALFTKFGGSVAAMLTLVMPSAVYVAASAAGYPYPFLLSLATALVTYLLAGSVERVAGRVHHA